MLNNGGNWTSPMRAVIADHESSDRDRLVELCNSHGGLANLIVVRSGTDAITQIRASRPDVAFLACELMDMSGFEVLHALGHHERPAAIMVAPDDRHLDEAFSSAATDYIMRPISANRLALALKRAGRGVGAPSPPAPAPVGSSRAGESRHASPALTFGARLVGERAGRLYFLSPIDVDYIEADSNYVQIHVGSDCYMSRDSLTRLSQLLECLGFVRISRAVLLNMQRVSFAEREERGVLAFMMHSGIRVISSTGCRLASGALARISRTRGLRSKRRMS